MNKKENPREEFLATGDIEIPCGPKNSLLLGFSDYAKRIGGNHFRRGNITDLPENSVNLEILYNRLHEKIYQYSAEREIDEGQISGIGVQLPVSDDPGEIRQNLEKLYDDVTQIVKDNIRSLITPKGRGNRPRES